MKKEKKRDNVENNSIKCNECEKMLKEKSLLLEKCRESEEGWKRSRADFENFKRRSEEEKVKILDYAKAEIVLSFLPLYDSLKRAKEAGVGCVDGVDRIIELFTNILKIYQIRKIDLDLNSFDPAKAEAIGFEKGEEKTDGGIAKIVEDGFETESGQLVKPAKVMVYKK